MLNFINKIIAHGHFGSDTFDQIDLLRSYAHLKSQLLCQHEELIQIRKDLDHMNARIRFCMKFANHMQYEEGFLMPIMNRNYKNYK